MTTRSILTAALLLICAAAPARAQLAEAQLPELGVDAEPARPTQAAAAAALALAEPSEMLELRRRTASSLGRHVAWGAAIGAAGGVLSGLFVIFQCEETCDENRAANVALHIGIGAAAGAAAGAILHLLRH